MQQSRGNTKAKWRKIWIFDFRKDCSKRRQFSVWIQGRTISHSYSPSLNIIIKEVFHFTGTIDSLHVWLYPVVMLMSVDVSCSCERGPWQLSAVWHWQWVWAVLTLTVDTNLCSSVDISQWPPCSTAAADKCVSPEEKGSPSHAILSVAFQHWYSLSNTCSNIN